METEKTGNQQEPGLVHRLRRYSDIIGDAGEFPVLDGLRAIAILLVLLRHAVHYREQGLEGSFWNIFYNGWIGVDLFFVLSGFLILPLVIKMASTFFLAFHRYIFHQKGITYPAIVFRYPVTDRSICHTLLQPPQPGHVA